MLKLSLLLAASVASVELMSARIDDGKTDKKSYTHEIETLAHAARRPAEGTERLAQPDRPASGSRKGRTRSARDKKSDIVLDNGSGAPRRRHAEERQGIDHARSCMRPRRSTASRSQSAVLADDTTAIPTVVAYGTASFYVIDRDGKKGLRVKDSEAATRKQFAGIEYYPIDPKWRVEATFTEFKPPHTLEIPNVLGQVDKMPVPGKVTFERDGKKYELLPVLEDPDAKELWFIFADKTSAKDNVRRRAVPLFGHAEGRQGHDRFQQGVQPAVRVHAACDVSAGAAGESAGVAGDGGGEEVSREGCA